MSDDRFAIERWDSEMPEMAMFKAERGEYVLFSAYEALLADRNELKARADELEIALAAGIERLRRDTRLSSTATVDDFSRALTAYRKADT